MSVTDAKDLKSTERDFMPLNGIDHVELWVGNAAQASYFFQRAFNFTEVAYRGLESATGSRACSSRERFGWW